MTRFWLIDPAGRPETMVDAPDMAALPALPPGYAWTDVEPTPEAPALVVPSVVPRWAAQAAMRMAPHGAGTLFTSADAMVRSTGDPILVAWWEGGSEMRRDSQALAMLAGLLAPPVPQDAVDLLFVTAAEIAERGL